MIDRAKLDARLATLRREHESGTALVQQLAAKQTEVAQTLLRIGGAIQVLEEVPAELIVLIGWMIVFLLAGLVVCISDAWKAVAP